MKYLLWFFIVVGLIQMALFGFRDELLPLIPGFYWPVVFIIYIKFWAAFSLINMWLIMGSFFLISKSGDDEAFSDLKVGDCITPKHNWSAYDHEFTDIEAFASAVHKESRK